MTTYTKETMKEMKANAERLRARAEKGEVAGPRMFVSDRIYTGNELRKSMRRSAIEDAPSLMGDVRRYRDGRIEKVE